MKNNGGKNQKRYQKKNPKAGAGREVVYEKETPEIQEKMRAAREKEWNNWQKYTNGKWITEAEFKKMKNSAYLVNCARGGTVDEDAMLKALDDGEIAGAGVDVFVGEPNPRADVVGHDKVICCPHLGASAVEGQDRIVDIVEDILKEELK